jgi:hypothetical protein
MVEGEQGGEGQESRDCVQSGLEREALGPKRRWTEGEKSAGEGQRLGGERARGGCGGWVAAKRARVGTGRGRLDLCPAVFCGPRTPPPRLRWRLHARRGPAWVREESWGFTGMLEHGSQYDGSEKPARD